MLKNEENDSEQLRDSELHLCYLNRYQIRDAYSNWHLTNAKYKYFLSHLNFKICTSTCNESYRF